MQRKRPGRPKKFSQTWVKRVGIPKLLAIMEAMTIDNVYRYHTVEALSVHLDMSRETFYQVIKQYDDFKRVVELWRVKAVSLFDAYAIVNKLPSGIYIFTRANISDWKRKDVVIVETPDTDKIKTWSEQMNEDDDEE